MPPACERECECAWRALDNVQDTRAASGRWVVLVVAVMVAAVTTMAAMAERWLQQRDARQGARGRIQTSYGGRRRWT